MLRFLAFATAAAVQAQTDPTFEDSAGLGAPNVGYRGRAAPMLTNPAQGWIIRDIDGNIITTASPNYASMIPRGSANHQHVELIIDTPNNLVINNLGGMGPNNGSFVNGQYGGVGNQANLNQPNFIQFANIATVGGQQVAMRIDNTSMYKPDRVQQNRKFNDFLLQINLDPIDDYAGTDDPYDIINMFPPALRPLFPPLLTQWEHRSKYTNQLNLFYSFFDQASGTPIELDEFCVVFYDFDQDWADGGKAYVRETVMVSDFTTMFYRPGSEEQLEFTFSKQWEDLLPQMPAFNGVQLDLPMAHTYFRGCDNNNICNGMLPQYTFTSWPYSEDRRMAVHRPITRTSPTPAGQTSIAEWPTYLNSEAAGHGNANWGFAPLYTTQESAAVSAMVLKKGIFIRSTTQGTGPAYSPKWYYGGCQGGCSLGTTCNMAQLTTSTNNQIPDWWTGCGIAQGYSETGSCPGRGCHPASWSCILDCPRTTVANDYGQPSNAQQDPLTPEGDQWYARAVIFMFRNKQNFTVTYRTEIGADNIDLMDRDRPDLVNSDLVDQNLQWIDDTQGKRSRLFGRNFLIGGFTAPLYQCSDLPTTCLSCCEYAHCYDALHSGTAPNQLPMSCQVPAIFGGRGGTAQASCMPSVIQGGAGVCQMPVAQCSDIPASCLTCTEYAHCYAALDAGTAASALPATCQTLPMGTALASCMPSTVMGGAGICEMPVMALLAGCATTTTCTACSDPHLALAHGGRADFKGAHNAWYSMLSAKNISFNALFLHDDFKNPYKLVHGSAMKATAWVIRTGITGTTVTIEYNATAQTLSRAMVKTSTSKAGQWVAHGARAFNLENVKVEMKEKKLVGAGVNGRGKAWHGMALVVTTGLWQISIWNKPYPNAAANPGKALLNINIEPLYDADNDVVAPHGLIGQSWDGDGLPTHGLLDDYSEAEVTTSAMGEGAIEGTAVDYQMKHGLATDFKFSRFDAVKAAHRDTTNLKKITRKDVAAAAVGATADVEDEA